METETIRYLNRERGPHHGRRFRAVLTDGRETVVRCVYDARHLVWLDSFGERVQPVEVRDRQERGRLPGPGKEHHGLARLG